MHKWRNTPPQIRFRLLEISHWANDLLPERRFRISVRTLLVVLTAAAVVFGYPQWRRQSILRECRELQADGVTIDAPADAIDKIWQRVPKSAVIQVEQALNNAFQVGPSRYTLADAQTHCRTLERRLAQLGVTSRTIIVMSGSTHFGVKSVDAWEELNAPSSLGEAKSAVLNPR